jgi:hypothetical protein
MKLDLVRGMAALMALMGMTSLSGCALWRGTEVGTTTVTGAPLTHPVTRFAPAQMEVEDIFGPEASVPPAPSTGGAPAEAPAAPASEDLPATRY